EGQGAARRHGSGRSGGGDRRGRGQRGPVADPELASPMAARPRRIPGTARVEAFSDGVIAIIITLLIFEVRLPELPADASNTEMLDAFGSIAPKLASF